MEYHSGGSLPLLGRPRYCPGASANGGYLCETGHCCGETGCCTYYYELWWFWMLWTVLILFSCCCAYRHRRAKLRVQQQQRQREISLLAYHGASSYPSSMLDLSFLASLKLPSYEEVAAQPSTPPPPYSSVFTTPRYPQPPRAADPHLLTQHDPLLHRPLSDGPSSLSSDNSSSCSCDSCCPSSPCSSSLSAPVTYETDTSHASTPSEATPLTLDVTMETIAASCLEADETSPTATIDMCAPQEPVATESSVPSQTVTVALVTRAASPQSPSSPGAAGTACGPTGGACSLGNLPDVPLPSIQIAPTRTLEPSTRILCSQVSAPTPDGGGGCTSMADSASPATRDPSSSIVPASSILTQSPVSGPVTEPVNLAPPPGPVPTSLVPGEAPANLSQGLEPEPEATSVPQPHGKTTSVHHLGLTVDTDAAAVVPVARSPESGPVAPAVVQLELTSPLPLHRFGSGSSSCPAINVESSALSPATPPRRPSPSTSFPAPSLLLDPLTALHPSDKAGSLGHASSLSPSPRATQSPPKQTLFSPCVDVFEPGPPNWGEEDDEDDVGADESQYRHRRLTGDSGIEVCRCRVDEEEEEDQEEERVKVGRRGGEKEKPDLHDSEDCPARGQTITGDGLTLCNPPPTSSSTAASEDKVVIAMETV